MPERQSCHAVNRLILQLRKFVWPFLKTLAPGGAVHVAGWSTCMFISENARRLHAPPAPSVCNQPIQSDSDIVEKLKVVGLWHSSGLHAHQRIGSDDGQPRCLGADRCGHHSEPFRHRLGLHQAPAVIGENPIMTRCPCQPGQSGQQTCQIAFEVIGNRFRPIADQIASNN
jgi:hypothetical protein